MHSKRVIRPELLNAHAHDAKHVPLFATLRNCRDQSDPLRSLITLPVPHHHLLYNLHSLQKVIHRRNRETTRRQIPRTPSRRREDDKNTSKPVARHFNLPNYSKQHMVVCGLSLHQGSTERHKTLEQKFIFQIGTLNPRSINEQFSFNKFILLFFMSQGTNQ